MNSGIEKIDLTIVIPTRNRPHELEAAVESALRQVSRNVEVIVVDDGSDRPVRLPSDSQLRCIRLDRSRGVAHARNTCGFRLMAITRFGRSRSPVSLQADHPFRTKPITG